MECHQILVYFHYQGAKEGIWWDFMDFSLSAYFFSSSKCRGPKKIYTNLIISSETLISMHSLMGMARDPAVPALDFRGTTTTFPNSHYRAVLVSTEGACAGKIGPKRKHPMLRRGWGVSRRPSGQKFSTQTQSFCLKCSFLYTFRWVCSGTLPSQLLVFEVFRTFSIENQRGKVTLLEVPEF